MRRDVGPWRKLFPTIAVRRHLKNSSHKHLVQLLWKIYITLLIQDQQLYLVIESQLNTINNF